MRCPRRATGGPPEVDDELWAEVAALPPKQRVAVVHRHVLDRPYAEIAVDHGHVGGGGPRQRGRRDAQPPGAVAVSGRDLRRLASPATAVERARAAAERVRERALDDGLVDVAVGLVDGPVGELQVAVTGRGLVYVAYDDEDREALVARYAGALSPRIVRSARATDEVRRELTEYFAGTRTAFELSVDRRLMHPFARKVLAATSRVGYGELATYGQIATRIGHPSAARAVGAALGSNPVPIVVPCHRIVGAGGRLTGYAGGIDRKEILLQLEGALPPRLV